MFEVDVDIDEDPLSDENETKEMVLATNAKSQKSTKRLGCVEQHPIPHKSLKTASGSEKKIKAHNDNQTEQPQPALQQLITALSGDASHVKDVFKEFFESYKVCK